MHTIRVSRTEIVEVVSPALARGPRSGHEIVSFAVAAGARPAVIEVLRGLWAPAYTDLRALWADLPDLPVEA